MNKQNEMLYDENMEMAVLSVIMNNSIDKTSYIFETIKEDDFYKTFHRQVFIAAKDLYLKNQDPDIISLSRRYTELDKNHENRIIDLNAIFDVILGYADVTSYIQKIKEFRMRRELKNVFNKAYVEIATDDLDKVIDGVQEDIYNISLSKDKEKDIIHVSESVKNVNKQLEENYAGGSKLLWLGYKHLDKKLNGLKKGNLVIVAARPAIGKTQFALNIALNLSAEGKVVLFYTLEMNDTELTSRLISIIANNNNDESFYNMINKKSEYINFTEATKKIEKADKMLKSVPLYMSDKSDITLVKIRNDIRKLKHIGINVDIVFLDYLQLIQTDSSNNRQEIIANLSRGLKVLAKTYGIPFVALSQLNRGVEQRENKRPMLSDLRESGAIEQDADMVIMLYRDEYYYPNTSEPGIMEVGIVKNRHGSVGTVKLVYAKERGLISDYYGEVIVGNNTEQSN